MASNVRKVGSTGSDQLDRVHDEEAARARSEATRRWLAENADAIRLENEYVEGRGLQLSKYRLF